MPQTTLSSIPCEDQETGYIRNSQNDIGLLGLWPRVWGVILTSLRARIVAATEPNLGREEKPIRCNIVVFRLMPFDADAVLRRRMGDRINRQQECGMFVMTIIRVIPPSS